VGTDLQEQLAAGRMPTKIADFTAQRRTPLPGKVNSTAFGDDDVLEMGVGGGGGFGDPLLRDPSDVMRDIADRYTTNAFAEAVYGVLLGANGEVDVDATAAQRKELRTQRQTWTLAPPDNSQEAGTVPASGEGPRQVHVAIDIADRGSERMYICRGCGYSIANAGGNFKLGLKMHEGPITVIPGAVDPAESLEQRMVFRRFCCPGCLELLTTEIARADDPIVCEMRLA
jgi:N-methylhydantoinase B